LLQFLSLLSLFPFLEVDLIAPHLVLVISSKAVDNDWQWKSENESATKSAKSAHNFSGKRRWSDVTISDSSESHEPPPD